VAILSHSSFSLKAVILRKDALVTQFGSVIAPLADTEAPIRFLGCIWRAMAVFNTDLKFLECI